MALVGLALRQADGQGDPQILFHFETKTTTCSFSEVCLEGKVQSVQVGVRVRCDD